MIKQINFASRARPHLSSPFVLLRSENEVQHMQIVFFFALWLVIALGVPAIVHVLFGSSEYPLVSLAVVFAFVGGAVLSALITGLLKDEQSSRSK
jgi:energy-converting hydrogenase Eha subunit A